MTFVTAGLAIAGACAVAIPIIIHLLFRQRRKPIEWAAMRFLIEAYRKHRKRLRLEQLLLLAVRCLIPLVLGFALARPLLQGALAPSMGGQRAAYLIIDDGLASSVKDHEDQTALERHVASAVDLINQLGSGDAVGVITASRPARALVVPPSTDHAAVINLIKALKPTESPTDLAGAFALARTTLEDQTSGVSGVGRESLVYLLSEFRDGSVTLDAPPISGVLDQANVRLLTTPAAVEGLANVQVVSIEPVRNLLLPGAIDGSGQVTVKLHRTGGQLGADVTRVRLSGEGVAPLEPKVVQWQPGQSEAQVEFQISLNAPGDGELGLTASIDDDALAGDNERHSVVSVRRKIRVLLVDRRSFGAEQRLDQISAGKWIRRALEPLEAGVIEVVEAEPAALDIADLRTADAAIVPRPDLLSDHGWSLLRGFLDRSGLLILMPPGEVNVHPWTEHLAMDLRLPWPMALETVEYPEGLALANEQPAGEVLRLISSDIADLVLPILTFRVLPIDPSATQTGGAHALLVFADGSPMIVAGTPAAPAASAPATDAGAGETRNGPTGLAVLFSVSPEVSWTSLPVKPLMVPLFHELIRQGLSVIRAAQKYGVGEQPNLAAGPAAADLISPDGRRVGIDRAGRVEAPLMNSGLFNIVDQSGQNIGRVAVNIDPRAAQTSAQSQAAVSAWLARAGRWETIDPGQPADVLGSTSRTSPLAWLLLAALLVLVIAETALARWFSHATTWGPGAQSPGVRPTIDESARAVPVTVSATGGPA